MADAAKHMQRFVADSWEAAPGAGGTPAGHTATATVWIEWVSAMTSMTGQGSTNSSEPRLLVSCVVKVSTGVQVTAMLLTSHPRAGLATRAGRLDGQVDGTAWVASSKRGTRVTDVRGQCAGRDSFASHSGSMIAEVVTVVGGGLSRRSFQGVW